MAIPNLACTLVRVLDTVNCNVNTSSNVNIFRVFAGHNKTNKIVRMVATNRTNATSTVLNVRYNSQAAVTHSLLANTTIGPNTSIQIVSPDRPLYLRESDRINAWASANGVVDINISYEALSDTDPNVFAVLSTIIPYPVDLFAVGGGGSGPYGGGGGGALVTANLDEMTAGLNVVVVVGAGGSSAGMNQGGTSNIMIPLSANTFQVPLTAPGGGYGPSTTPTNGNPGSSGGGGGGYGGGGGLGTPGLGQPGGGGGGYINGAGGGGGITGGGGGSWAYFHGGGGGGLAFQFGSVPITYGAGGAGAGGGAGGGVGTGGGGSGGAPGGPGTVSIRYAGAQRGLGGNVESFGGYTYHTFTSSGIYKS